MTENAVIYSGWMQAGKTWSAIAGEVGCTVHTLNNWRRERVKVPANRWHKLCEAMGVDPENLTYANYVQSYEDGQNAAPAPETAPEAPKHAP